VRSVLFVGAGRHQRRAILRAKELGLRVVAVDRNPDALGLREADAGEAVDFTDIDAVTAVARRHRVDGVLTVSADRAVPVVAAVAETLGLPGIGTETAHRLTHKIAMRRILAEAGVPQPRFAAARDLASARAAGETVGFPAVLKPADSGGQRGVFLVPSQDELDGHLHAALAESAEGEAIVERFHDGLELNGIAIARDGDVQVLTLSDRLRPPGVGFGVGWIHVYPASIYGDTLAEAERVAAHAVRVLGLENGIAFPQLLVDDDGSVRVVEVAARIPGGQMADLVRHAVGVDLADVALRFALGEPVPDELVEPSISQPLAIRFLTARPGPLPTGKVTRIGPLEPVLAAEGIVQAETYLQVGETIRPVRLDGDRRGYVIAVADTSVEALERAERAARLLEVDVEGRGRSLPETWEEFRRLPFPDDSGEEVVQELAEYDGYAAGLVSQVVSGAEPSLPLEIDEALTLRIEATGSTELIDYVRRLNELILAARGEESRQA
jgi:biotin carboxylase